MATSLTSYLALGVQASKGTALVTGLISGRFTASVGSPQYDYIEPQFEHFRGVGARPTVRKTMGQRSSYIVPFGAQGYLYPILLGNLLRGIGFSIATSGDAPEYTHVATLAARDAMPWLTGVLGRGDGAGLWERKFVDGRLEALQIGGGPRGLTCQFQGSALREANVAGTETYVSESDELIIPSSGSATITVDGSAYTGAIRGMQFQIQNQIDKNEQQLFAFERGDLQNMGLDCQFQLMNLDVDAALYDTFHKNDAAGDKPGIRGIAGAIEMTFQSANDIPTGSNPFSVTIEIPSVEMRLGAVQSQRNQLIRTSLGAFMIDNVTTPITVTLVNNHASYS